MVSSFGALYVPGFINFSLAKMCSGLRLCWDPGLAPPLAGPFRTLYIAKYCNVLNEGMLRLFGLRWYSSLSPPTAASSRVLYIARGKALSVMEVYSGLSPLHGGCIWRPVHCWTYWTVLCECMLGPLGLNGIEVLALASRLPPESFTLTCLSLWTLLGLGRWPFHGNGRSIPVHCMENSLVYDLWREVWLDLRPLNSCKFSNPLLFSIWRFMLNPWRMKVCSGVDPYSRLGLGTLRELLLDCCTLADMCCCPWWRPVRPCLSHGSFH